MARYPTFEEYDKRGNYADGIKRCNDLLAKNANDVQLLTTKLQLLYVTSLDDANKLLDDIAGLPNPIQDLGQIAAIEQAIVESLSYRTTFPQPLTAGAAVAKLWDNALKSSTSSSHKHDVLSIRFDRAIADNRIQDAQQALIQLKALQPKNRGLYMAHAALTQMLSKSNEDLQARLAIGLARKAVTERFDEDKSLDCRVPGQIFALQDSKNDLEGIKGRAFTESKQVFDAVREAVKDDSDGEVAVPDPAIVPSNLWLSAELSSLKHQFRLLNASQSPSTEAFTAFAVNGIRLFLASITSLSAGARRSPADACFLSISALVKLWTLTASSIHLLHAAYLADTLLKNNPHIHEARLILVYLYMRLGLGSSAIRLFESLSVKEVQHDTIGHSLFTRLSLTHPHPTILGRRETLDPSKRMLHALSVYTRCENKLADTEASVLVHGQTGMLFDLQDLRTNLRASVSRRITVLEQRRTSRLTQPTAVAGSGDNAARAFGPEVVANWLKANTKDNRDFNAAFDYGFNAERALHCNGDGGNIPGEAWILCCLAADTAWSFANGQRTLVHDTEKIVSEIQRHLASPQIGQSLSPAEYLAGDLSYHILRLALSTEIEQESTILASLHTSLERLNMPLLTSAEEAADPLANTLSTHYAYIDVLCTLCATCTYQQKKQQRLKLPSSSSDPDTSSQLVSLHALARAHISSLQKHAKEQAAKFQKAVGLKTLFMREGGEGVYAALREFGERGIEVFCEEVAKSAKEGWEGVGKVDEWDGQMGSFGM